jgi:hypothetical protein
MYIYKVGRISTNKNSQISKFKGFGGYLNAIKYRKYYIKKKLGIKLNEKEKIFFENFENELHLN